jgi:undecaprenyl pyrophosphate phosphatase UppP
MAAPNTVAFSGSTITGLSSPVGVGAAAASTVGFYGATPVAQRASSLQATSNISGISTGAVSTNSILLNTVVEIMNTLNGLGIWKGAA